MGHLPCLALGLLFFQRIDQLYRGEEPHPSVMVFNGLHSEGCGNVGLACARPAHQHHVVGILQELTPVQLAHQGFVHLAVAEVEACQVPVRGEPGHLQLVSHRAHLPLGGLSLEQLGQDVRTKLQVAHFKLSHSRAFYLRAYLRQTHEMLFDAHNHAFVVLGGVPRRGIYDNMRTAVDRVRRGKERDVNARFAAMVSHFLFEAEFCNPASGWEKGQVEKNVRDARHRLWQVVPPFPSLPDLNAWLEERCVALWHEIEHGKLAGTVADVWAEERAALMPVPRPFDGFVEHTKRVSPTCLVHFERNRYSVPAPYANRPVSLRVYADRLVVAAEGQIICEHQRLIERNHHGAGQTVYDWRHYLAVLQRKPGALRNGAPFQELPVAFKRLQTALLKQPGGDREMVEVLALVLHHDEQAVLAAVELALESGAASKTHILNVLHRLLDGKPAPAPVTSPQALKLAVEPQANVLRYDQLREVRYAS